MGVATYAIIMAILQDGMHWFMLALAIVFGLLALLGLYTFVIDIPKIFKLKEYKKEEVRKVEEYLNSSIDEDDLKASMQRMSNPIYVRSLMEHGVDVPEFFLKRLGDKYYYELAEFKKNQAQEENVNY